VVLVTSAQENPGLASRGWLILLRTGWLSGATGSHELEQGFGDRMREVSDQHVARAHAQEHLPALRQAHQAQAAGLHRAMVLQQVLTARPPRGLRNAAKAKPTEKDGEHPPSPGRTTKTTAT
jgi:hypothetical protein